MSNLRAIDLFCGCGGISCGLARAGYTVIAGVDIEKKYIQTFAKNFPNAKTICGDLREIEPENLMNELGIKPGELDLLAGGPPCQGFSKNVPLKNRSKDSDNNQLINRYLAFCKALKPKYIMMENVAEMVNGFDSHYTDLIIGELRALKYNVLHGVHNAADFGVPQKRRRAFFIARNDGKPVKEPAPTHTPSKQATLFESKTHISVWDAISDMPSLKSGEGTEISKYRCAPENDFQTQMRLSQKELLNHTARKLDPLQYERIASLKPGQGIKDLPAEIRPKGGYSGAYGRLTKEMVCPTITRWVFHPGSGRWGHPVDLRLITIREAARLHSFPDNFIFYGSYNDQAGQIGNSVPPLLAEIVARSFLQ